MSPIPMRGEGQILHVVLISPENWIVERNGTNFKELLIEWEGETEKWVETGWQQEKPVANVEIKSPVV